MAFAYIKLLGAGTIYLLIATSAFCQKVSRCELSDVTIEKDGKMQNGVLGIRVEIPKWYYFARAAGTLRGGIFFLYKNTLLFELKDARKTDATRVVELYAVKSFLTAPSERDLINNVVNEFNYFKKYTVDLNSDGSTLFSYQDSKGLWWYYMKVRAPSRPEQINYIIVKNYNNHISLLYMLSNLGIEERVGDFIELIEIHDWNLKLKMKAKC